MSVSPLKGWIEKCESTRSLFAERTCEWLQLVRFSLAVPIGVIRGFPRSKYLDLFVCTLRPRNGAIPPEQGEQAHKRALEYPGRQVLTCTPPPSNGAFTTTAGTHSHRDFSITFDDRPSTPPIHYQNSHVILHASTATHHLPTRQMIDTLPMSIGSFLSLLLWFKIERA
jgi:hypothetical protein